MDEPVDRSTKESFLAWLTRALELGRARIIERLKPEVIEELLAHLEREGRADLLAEVREAIETQPWKHPLDKLLESKFDEYEPEQDRDHFAAVFRDPFHSSRVLWRAHLFNWLSCDAQCRLLESFGRTRDTIIGLSPSAGRRVVPRWSPSKRARRVYEAIGYDLNRFELESHVGPTFGDAQRAIDIVLEFTKCPGGPHETNRSATCRCNSDQALADLLHGDRTKPLRTGAHRDSIEPLRPVLAWLEGIFLDTFDRHLLAEAYLEAADERKRLAEEKRKREKLVSAQAELVSRALAEEIANADRRIFEMEEKLARSFPIIAPNDVLRKEASLRKNKRGREMTLEAIADEASDHFEVERIRSWRRFRETLRSNTDAPPLCAEITRYLEADLAQPGSDPAETKAKNPSRLRYIDHAIAGMHEVLKRLQRQAGLTQGDELQHGIREANYALIDNALAYFLPPGQYPEPREHAGDRPEDRSNASGDAAARIRRRFLPDQLYKRLHGRNAIVRLRIAMSAIAKEPLSIQ